MADALSQETKDYLKAMAQEHGFNVPASATKAQICQKLAEFGVAKRMMMEQRLQGNMHPADFGVAPRARGQYPRSQPVQAMQYNQYAQGDGW